MVVWQPSDYRQVVQVMVVWQPSDYRKVIQPIVVWQLSGYKEVAQVANVDVIAVRQLSGSRQGTQRSVSSV